MSARFTPTAVPKVEVSTGSSGPPDSAPVPDARAKPLKVAILIVSYNAVSTLRWLLDRIPEAVWDKVAEVMVFDDSSQDDTYLVGLGYKSLHGREKLSIFRNERNLGYGGNQKRGYRYAIDRGYDVVALLHGDGQYAPEVLTDLLSPIERGEADAVFGSRMMQAGAARKGGMPLYKYLGNKVLSSFENFALGMNLTEFHSGYRVYACNALKQVPFEKNTDDFHFDTQIIIQLQAAGQRITERPIPTYYGDEICYVNGMKYARDIFNSVLHYKLHQLGLRHDAAYQVREPYRLKTSPVASHSKLAELVGPASRRVLDVGCGEGELGHQLRSQGHHVIGLDQHPPRFELDDFIKCDLEDGLHLPQRARFDVILLADILEHFQQPQQMLQKLRSHLATGGFMLISLPNTVHWSVRAQVAAGSFEYTNRGLLDRTHLRLFTRRSAERMLADSGWRVVAHTTTPVPWENVLPGLGQGAIGRGMLRSVERFDFRLSSRWPNLFAYQNIFKVVDSEQVDP